jgi:hypothetical protein
MIRRTSWPFLLMVLAYAGLALSLPGCGVNAGQRQQVREGKVYGTTEGAFRERWWQYYRRGLSFSEGQFWTEAETDLRAAVQLRDEDQRRKKAYGLHFIDYFPHRELGVVLFHQGRYEEAVRELELSLTGEKSAKAEFYLDWVRKTLIEQQGRDTQAPAVIWDEPVESSLTNRLACLVSGKVTDDTYVKDVDVSGMPVRLDLAAREAPFRVVVSLSSGDNLIRIRAADLAGKVTVSERVIRADWEGPVISIDQLVEKASQGRRQLQLRGYVDDDSGLAQVLVNGGPTGRVGDREVKLDVTVPLDQGASPVIIEALDRAGNRTRMELDPAGKPVVNRRVYLAALEPTRLALLGVPREAVDRYPPVIELRTWSGEQTTFLDQVLLEGTVSDESGVEALLINGQSILRRPGKRVSFNHLAKLAEGPNQILLESRDTVGNRVENRMTIIRKVPQVRQLGSRLRVALLPVERVGGTFSGREPIEENLLTGLLERKRFDLIERRRMEDVLRELRLSQSDLVQPEAAVKMGKILAAQGLLFGSVAAGEGSMEIYLRLVDAETGLVIAGVDVYGEELNASAVRELCRGLVLKLCDELPVSEGTIVQVKGERVITDLGQDKHIKKGMRLIVFQESEPLRHPLTGMVLGSDLQPLGRGRIMAVQELLSEVEVTEQGSVGLLKPMQKVITQ